MTADPELDRALRDAVAARLVRTGGMLVSDDARNQFSCAFIRSGQAHVAVTCGHGLSDVADWDSLELVTPNQFGVRVKEIRKSSGWLDPRTCPGMPNFDIGFLEIDPVAAASMNVDWVPRELATSVGLRERSGIAVYGLPAALLEVHAARRKLVVGKPAMLLTQVTGRRPDPAALRSPVNEDVDIWVEYPRDQMIDGRSRQPTPRLPPFGLSGCGAFRIHRVVDGELWNSRDIELVAIQSGFLDMTGLLRLVRIDYVYRIPGFPVGAGNRLTSP